MRNRWLKRALISLYQLKFEEARRQFADWQKDNPQDPLGYEAVAASYLFEEFYDQKVLTSEFFLNDELLLGGIQGKPDESRKRNFEAANQKGRSLALEQLNLDPQDANCIICADDFHRDARELCVNFGEASDGEPVPD